MLSGVGLVAGVAWGSLVAAQPLPTAAEPWRFQLTPYVWGIGVQGSVRPAEAPWPEVRFRRGFNDILNDLDGAVFVTATARRGAWTLGFDYGWSAQSQTQSVLGRLTTETRLRLSSGTLAAGYAVLDHPRLSLDVLAGVRGWDTSIRAQLPNLGLSQRVRERWLDPVVGIKVRWQFSERWSVTGYADVGGIFSQGGANSTRQVYGVANLALSEAWSVSLGYRYLDVNYRRDPVQIDVALQGPLLGVSYRF